jgi:Holliday junction resolvase RusA-like endonuclease
MPTTHLTKLKIWLPGAVTPKARPRVTANGVYFPQKYQQWRCRAEGEIICQVYGVSLPLPNPVAVRVVLQGKGHRGDLDNLAGSCLDALVSAGVLEDDRLSCVSRLVVEHQPEGEKGCWVEIEPIK